MVPAGEQKKKPRASETDRGKVPAARRKVKGMTRLVAGAAIMQRAGSPQYPGRCRSAMRGQHWKSPGARFTPGLLGTRAGECGPDQHRSACPSRQP